MRSVLVSALEERRPVGLILFTWLAATSPGIPSFDTSPDGFKAAIGSQACGSISSHVLLI